MKNISVEVDDIIKDENDDWIVGVGEGLKLRCEDGTEACAESIITIGDHNLRIEDLVEFLQLIGMLTEECYR